MAEKRKRIGLLSIIFMPMVAVFFDILDLIPGINLVAGIGFWIVMTLWLTLLGVSMFSVRRLATAGASIIIGVIPFLSALPQLTLATIAIILMVKSEDSLGIKLPLSKK